MMNTQQVWNTFKGDLHRFIKFKVNDTSVADDILQDVFIKIHSNLDHLKDEKKLSSWVYQLTRNTIIDYYRKKQLLFKDVEGMENQFFIEDSPEDERYCKECVRPFILELPEDYKDAILKITYENISQKEYAEKNGLAYSTVKSRVQRGRDQLKKSFETCCVDNQGDNECCSDRN
ncbi:RNA polymerase sigma factor SigZ [Flammeovirga sp. MY04]|uniref:RNA polymerase sigma factor SigZ n=1 Tax=Flammeovirga sp. MY04 TaxID=1191459 RepID=UPI0009FBBBFD|nr:RNA polymerase sigma factor SigZ [Flammeovirga sp. MY04]ANQ50122.2 RNA polymerase sigma factor SigZ [Flammeovirga sp. MY04]